MVASLLKSAPKELLLRGWYFWAGEWRTSKLDVWFRWQGAGKHLEREQCAITLQMILLRGQVPTACGGA